MKETGVKSEENLELKQYFMQPVCTEMCPFFIQQFAYSLWKLCTIC